MNKFMCLGFVFCLHKPHPKFNKCHTICWGESGIMYCWDIFEGGDNLIPIGRPEFESSPNMNVVGLILRQTRASCSTGRELIMDRNIFVLKGILETRKRGVYGS